MSTGLPAAPNGGMNLRNAASRSGGIAISDMPVATTEADNRRDAHLGGTREADDGHADAAGLRRQCRRTLDVISGAEGGAEIGGGIVEAVDVRPHQADVVFLADLDDFGLQFRRARFG